MLELPGGRDTTGLGEAGATIPRGTGEQHRDEKWSDSGYILKVEPKGFADGSGVAGERKEGQG